MNVHVVLSHYGYLGVAVALILEFLFIPFPAETILVVSGVMWHRGLFHLLPLLATAIVGSWSGSLIAYFIGGRLGRPVLVRYGKYIRLDEANLLRAEVAFRKYSIAILGVGRFIAGIRVLIAYVAGINEMGLGLYALISFVSAALWASAFIMIGGTIGTYWHTIRLWVMTHPWLSGIIGLVILLALYYLWRRRRQKQRQKVKVVEPNLL